ncbi:MAG: hypothetical protein R2699_03570 [Acidimicrobiales bacterium]
MQLPLIAAPELEAVYVFATTPGLHDAQLRAPRRRSIPPTRAASRSTPSRRASASASRHRSPGRRRASASTTSTT